jgi:hypothetical protein
MRSNPAIDSGSRHCSRMDRVTRLPRLVAERSTIPDNDVVEQGAQALFEFVFATCGRLDGKHQWASSDEQTKEGFRGEAKAVLVAAWPLLFR